MKKGMILKTNGNRTFEVLKVRARTVKVCEVKHIFDGPNKVIPMRDHFVGKPIARKVHYNVYGEHIHISKREIATAA